MTKFLTNWQTQWTGAAGACRARWRWRARRWRSLPSGPSNSAPIWGITSWRCIYNLLPLSQVSKHGSLINLSVGECKQSCREGASTRSEPSLGTSFRSGLCSSVHFWTFQFDGNVKNAEDWSYFSPFTWRKLERTCLWSEGLSSSLYVMILRSLLLLLQKVISEPTRKQARSRHFSDNVSFVWFFCKFGNVRL